MKTHYELLSVDPSAPAEEIKKAFRREIARYHPDKVQHLGSEFQEIAASRAAALTEAYRILMDAELRSRYDDAIVDDVDAQAPPPPPPRSEPARPVEEPPEPPSPGEPPRVDNRFAKDRATTTGFLRRAVLSRVADALSTVNAQPITVSGFDAAFAIKGRKGLFKKAEPNIRLLVRVVDTVDGAAVQEVWPPAVRAVTPEDTLCVLLMGSGLAPARELAAAVSEQRRKARKANVLVVPIDMRDWEAFLPPETPVVVRSLLERLRQAD